MGPTSPSVIASCCEPSWQTRSRGSPTNLTRERSPRTTAAIRWPPPVRRTAWLRPSPKKTRKDPTMLLRRQYERLLLSPSDIQASRDDFEVVGVFNPGAIVADGEVVLLVRVAERPRECRHGYVALPRWSAEDGLVIDWLADDVVEFVDPRVVKRKADGLIRLTFISHIRVVKCGDG